MRTPGVYGDVGCEEEVKPGEAAVRAFLQAVTMKLREEDRTCTVDVDGRRWDAYHFMHNGQKGTIAFTVVTKVDGEEELEIAALSRGHRTEEQIVKEIRARHS